MTTNFEIEGNYAVKYEDVIHDLHNDFDFLSFHYDIVNRAFELKWKRNVEDRVKNDGVNELRLIHKAVTYLTISPRDEAYPFSEDTCLMNLTFFPSTHREMNDSTGDQSKPDADDDILYIFQDERTIRICCGEIELQVL